jgi:hypothetical protein
MKENNNFPNNEQFGNNLSSGAVFPSSNTMEKGSNTSSKKKKKKKGFTKIGETKINSGEEFNLYGRGQVKYASIHGEANRPMKKLKEPDDSLAFCPCCNLPEQKDGYLELFVTCSDPDEFSSCGQGVVLYYSFIKFLVMVGILVSICMTALNMYTSYTYTMELQELCNNYYKNEFKYDKSLKDNCKYYFTEAEEDSEYYNLVDSIFFIFSAPNVKDYRKVYKKLYSRQNSNLSMFESSILNISRLNFFCLVFTFAFNLVYIYILFNKANAADYLELTVSDYAVILYNLYDVHQKFLDNLKEINKKKEEAEKTGKKFVPKLEYFKIGCIPTEGMSELDIFKEHIKEKIIGKQYKVNRVDVSYKIKELMKLEEELEERNEKVARTEFDEEMAEKNEKKGLEGDDRLCYTPYLFICEKEEKLEEIKKEIAERKEKIESLIEKSKVDTQESFGGTAFVTFETIKEQEKYMDKLPSNFFTYMYNFIRNLGYMFCSCCIDKSKENIYYLKRNVKFEAAPEPEEIIFENLEITPSSRIIRTLVVYIISILILVVSLFIIIGLNNLQKYVDERNQGSSQVVLLYIISLAFTVVSTAMDILLEFSLKSLTKIERQITQTKHNLSFSIKLSLLTFVNSAVLPLVAELIDRSDGYEILLSNMIMKFAMNAFVTPLMWTMNFSYFLKKICICYINKKIKDGKKVGKNQKELNELYEYPEMDVTVRYSYFVKTLLMSFLFIPIMPYGITISLVGFIFGYWLEKFNFANMYKRPDLLNREIVEFYVNYFVFILFVYGIGDYIFLSDAYNTKVWSLLNIIIFGVMIIFPYNQLLSIDSLDFDESKIYDKTYNQVYFDFSNDYERVNPMTKKEGTIRYLTELKNQNHITQEEYDKHIKDINSANLMELYYNTKKSMKRRGGFGGGMGRGLPGRRGPRNFNDHIRMMMNPNQQGFFPGNRMNFMKRENLKNTEGDNRMFPGNEGYNNMNIYSNNPFPHGPGPYNEYQKLNKN